jgi:iron complex transport system ATP-binding protein
MIDLLNVEIGHRETLFSIPDLRLEKGKAYVLIGANGAGKTTFFQAITGVVLPLKGKIKVDDLLFSAWSQRERAKKISFVSSKFDGIEFLRVRDYIALGRTPYTNAFGRLSQIDWSLVDEAIGFLQLEKMSGYFTTQLSDGERQLVAIARAVAQQTDLIILDEPTAFLDYANRKKVMQLMKLIAEQLNKCILISSHDLELCLESEISMLVIDKHKQQLVHYGPKSIDKTELISIGF